MTKIDINNFQVCKKIVVNFTNDYLKNSITNLGDFSFWSLLDDYDNAYEKGYLYCSKKIEKNVYLKDFDGDRLIITYAINYLLYHDKEIPSFTGNLGYLYTGDTINTYNTLFGNKFNYDKDGIAIDKIVEDLYEFNDGSTLVKQRDEFFKIYQTIGNFYLLPKEVPGTGRSINQYRGTCYWKDYFDIFIFHLDKCLENQITQKEFELNTYLKLPIANAFFSKFNKINKFCKLFMLEEYVGFNFDHIGEKYLFHHNDFDIDKTKYKQFCMSYMENASKKIKNRSDKIVTELRNKGL